MSSARPLRLAISTFILDPHRFLGAKRGSLRAHILYLYEACVVAPESPTRRRLRDMSRRAGMMVFLSICFGVITAGVPSFWPSRGIAWAQETVPLLRDERQEVVELREYARELLAELKATRDALTSAEREKAAALERANAAAEKARWEVIDFKVRREKELTARERELESARKQIATLKAEEEKRAAQERGLAEEITKLRTAEAQQRKEREDVASAVKRLEGERQKIELEKQKIAGELGQMAKTRDEAIQKQETIFRQGREETQGLKKQIDETQKKFTELERRYKELEVTQAQKVNESEAKTGEELAVARSKVKELEGSVAQERKEREKAQGELNRLEQERQKLATDLEQVAKTRNEEVKKQEKTSAGTREEISPAGQEEARRLGQALEESQRRIVDLEKEHKELEKTQEQVLALKTEIERLRTASTESEKERVNAQADTKRLEGEKQEPATARDQVAKNRDDLTQKAEAIPKVDRGEISKQGRSEGQDFFKQLRRSWRWRWNRWRD